MKLNPCPSANLVMAMRSSIWQVPPFKLLLHMEWILLGIAVISSLSHISVRLRGLPSGGRELPPQGPGVLLVMSLASLFCVLAVGGLGWRLPLGGEERRHAGMGGWLGDSGGERLLSNRHSRRMVVALLYMAGCFGLSWFAVILGGRGSMLFPPLLLILVTRGCLLFPGPGRWGIAGTALGSFVGMQYLALQRVRPLGIPLDRLPKLPGGRRLPDELVQSLRLHAMFNVTLLFVLVLGFVLLLVQALLQEAQSRQKLAEANQQLRRYSLRIEDQAALQERSRIAREIHDTVGHSLTAQSIQLENVALRLQTDADLGNVEQANQHLRNARRLGREALQNVRQAVARLRIHPLQGQSLKEAIAKLVNEFQGHSPTLLTSNIELQQSPSQDVAIVIYRILQEGLTNLTKHSQATTAQLEIYQDAEGIHLRLSDDGNGFDPAQNTTGFGLQSMAERAAAVNGRFQLRSNPGEGCSLALDVPI